MSSNRVNRMEEDPAFQTLAGMAEAGSGSHRTRLLLNYRRKHQLFSPEVFATERGYMPSLPLTPIESYFFYDHRESHPAWIRYDFTFRGALERAALERALERIVQRHPRTGATVAERRWRGPIWKLGAARPELHWRAAAAVEDDHDDPRERHDLSTRAGLRTVVRAGAAETHLTLTVHHAVADGLGVHVIARDLLLLYAIECGAPIVLPEVAPLSPRRDRRSSDAAAWRQLPWVAFGVVWGALLGRQRVVELRGAAEGGRRRELGAHCLSVDDTVRLRKAARTAGVSMNELVLRDVQMTLAAWLQRHGPARPEDWTRVLVPMNVGGARVSLQCSTNALGVALIERRVRSLGRRARLLHRAHEDMEFIQRRGLMRAFGALMRLRSWLPGGIARHCRRGGTRSTLVFSNIGKIFSTSALVRPDGVLAVPGAELTDVAAWGPCRPGSNIFAATGSYRGRQSFWVAFDPAAMSAAQAEDFAGEWEAQVQRSLAGEEAPEHVR